VKIGVDATCWWNNRGFGRFTRELLGAMFRLDSDHTFHLFSDQPIEALRSFGNVRLTLVPSSRPTTEAAVADSSRSPIDMLRLSRAVYRAPLDLMFFPAVYSWFPVPQKIPTMLTVMDAIAEHYPQMIFPDWRSRLFWKLKMRGALLNSQRVLTISQAAKQEIREYIGVDPAIIDVCSCAPNPDFVKTDDIERIAGARRRAQLPMEAPIIVYVGGMAPHKNLHGLLSGFEIACRSGAMDDVHLALVGDFAGAGFHSNYDSLAQRVAASGSLRNRVHFTGYVSDSDLVALYSSARAAAMPSFSEGFGLPAIEAMACSAPLLSSSLGSLPEVVGDAGIYFDPFDPEAIADAIVSMVRDDELHHRLSRNGLDRAAEFTWERAAVLALDHLERMYASFK